MECACFFFFKQKTAYEMRISDWSSDVCSSDLIAAAIAADPYDRARLAALLDEHRRRLDTFQEGIQSGLLAAVDAMTPEQREQYAERMLRHGPPGAPPRPEDRKSVVWGKSVSVRVDLGGGRRIKKKKNTT